EDAEINSWIEQIRESVPNREVIKAIMAGPDATIDDQCHLLKQIYMKNLKTASFYPCYYSQSIC
ncbi:MAG: hypothetical protein ACI4EC_04835, partial [Lachnospiraceae bacterium]